MFYAISTDVESHRLQLTIFDSRERRDLFVALNWKWDAFAVTARQARNWVKSVKYIDTNGTDPLGWLGRGGYPQWLDDAIDRADHAFGTYESPTYVMA